MKKIILVLAVLVVSVSSAYAAKTQAVAYVNGMVCSFCAQGITKKFKERKEVESVKVKLAEHTVSLVFNTDADISDKEITDLLRKAGYSVEKIERTKS